MNRSPSTDEQKKALAAATSVAESIGQGRLQMSFALFNAVSYPLLLIVIGCPYSGLLRASPAPLQQALAIMGKE